ncbi:MAG: type II toxin-antitoxin system RelE/ParE family toxin [Candidatus Hydrogenedentes bacterium]|nr:type II toxin-antitoxin system RelE/ParE family toxin [Candidatus Hydrogenedentota bacterium]
MGVIQRYKNCKGVRFAPPHSNPISFLGNTQRILQGLPEGARKKLGFALRIVQMGSRPDNVKALAEFPVQVLEIRVRDVKEAYRAVYTVVLGDRVYLLHVFHKKSKKGIGIPPQDLEIIRQRLKEAMELEAEQQ